MATDNMSMKKVNDELARHSDILEDLMESVHSIKRFVVKIDRKISNIESQQENVTPEGGARPDCADVAGLQKTNEPPACQSGAVSTGLHDVIRNVVHDVINASVHDVINRKCVEIKQHVSQAVDNLQVFASEMFEKKMNTLRCHIADDIVKKIEEVGEGLLSGNVEVMNDIREQRERIGKNLKETMAENIREVTSLKEKDIQLIKELKDEAASVVENIQNETQKMLESNKQLSSEIDVRMSRMIDHTIKREELTNALADIKKTTQQQLKRQDVLTKKEHVDRLAELKHLIDQLPQTGQLMLKEENMRENLNVIKRKAEEAKTAAGPVKVSKTRPDFPSE